MTTYVDKLEYRQQKSRLTRAINSGDPLKVLGAVETTLDEWGQSVWPDDWARWARALDDAFYAFARSEAQDDDVFENGGVLTARFHRTFDRIH